VEERFGFIHGEKDIKVLVLFILNRLPDAVPMDELSDVTLVCDGGIGYFELTDCVADLVRTGHVTEKSGRYKITAKGCENGKATESDLPYSVRIRAERAATALANIQRRGALITTSHEMRRRGGFMVKLAMSDGVGPILSMELLAGNDRQAEQVEGNFKKNAEAIYDKILDILLEK